MTQQCILLVDDNRDSCDMMRELLSLGGHDVLAVYDGITAITVATQKNPSLLLLDIGLPDMSGWDVARTLRSNGFGGLIYALTGYSDLDNIQLSMGAGMNHHFVKPLDLHDLVQKAHEHGLDV